VGRLIIPAKELISSGPISQIGGIGPIGVELAYVDVKIGIDLDSIWLREILGQSETGGTPIFVAMACSPAQGQ
jgi:hypothetical protein